MKFKLGDIVIYISHAEDWYQAARLEIGKKYIVDNISISNDTLYVKGKIYGYSDNRFISLEDFRRMKLEKIKDEISKRRQNYMYQ